MNVKKRIRIAEPRANVTVNPHDILTDPLTRRTIESPELQEFLSGIQFDLKKGFAGDWVNYVGYMVSAMALSAEPGKKGKMEKLLASMASGFKTYRQFWVEEVGNFAVKMGWSTRRAREVERLPEGTAAAALQKLSVQIGLLMLHPMTANRWEKLKDAITDVYLITFGEARAKQIRQTLDEVEPPEMKGLDKKK